MTKYLCRKCGKVFKTDLEYKDIVCPRCKQKDFSNYSKVVKNYYYCNKCKNNFRIGDAGAIALLKTKKNAECPQCGSMATRPGLKKDYLKQSGQLKKIHNTIQKRHNYFKV